MGAAASATIRRYVGIRQESNNRLLAFITGVPANVRVKTKVMPMTEINFLCVHKSSGPAVMP